MACDVFIIALRDEKKGENTSVYTIEAGDRLSPQSVPGSQGLTGAVINEGKSIILRNDNEIGQRAVLHFGSPRQVQSVVAVPLRMSGRVTGMISAQSFRAALYFAISSKKSLCALKKKLRRGAKSSTASPRSTAHQRAICVHGRLRYRRQCCGRARTRSRRHPRR